MVPVLDVIGQLPPVALELRCRKSRGSEAKFPFDDAEVAVAEGANRRCR